jgi:hypothetical protein
MSAFFNPGARFRRMNQGRYYWELRSCDYMEEFDKPKIMRQEIQFHSWYCWEGGRAVVNNKSAMAPLVEVIDHRHAFEAETTDAARGAFLYRTQMAGLSLGSLS